MLDAEQSLRAGYADRLIGAITYNSVVVPVYDGSAVPTFAKYPYIAISSFDSTEIGQGSKESYGLELSILIDIFTQFASGTNGKVMATDIAGQVISLIRTRTAGQISMGADWNVITTVMESTQTLEQQNATSMVVRRLIRFGHKVQQLVSNS